MATSSMDITTHFRETPKSSPAPSTTTPSTKKMQKTVYRYWGMACLGFIAILMLCATILHFLWEFNSEHSCEYLDEVTGPDQVLITAHIINADFPTNKYHVSVRPEVYGKYSINGNKRVPSRNLTITYGSDIRSFPAGAHFYAYSLELIFSDGDLYSYPFDVWHSSIVFMVTVDNVLTPFNLEVVDSVSSNSLVCTREMAGEVYFLDFKVHRGRPAMAISVFLAILIWVITLVYIIATYEVVIGRIEKPIEIAILGATMIFAMTSLRTMQPGVPTTECKTDILAFYWGTVVQSICFITVFTAWVCRKSYVGQSFWGFIKKRWARKEKTEGSPNIAV
jgi:hypothetical protein